MKILKEIPSEFFASYSINSIENNNLIYRIDWNNTEIDIYIAAENSNDYNLIFNTSDYSLYDTIQSFP